MRYRLLMILWLFTFAPTAAEAWHHEGHHLIAKKAVESPPERVPAFFREGAATVAHISIDPDMLRNIAAPQLSDANAPEHYLDTEALKGRKLPPKRSQYLALIGELKLKPKHAGFLPYSLTESTQALMIAFAEHRKWPDNPHVKSKCLLYAGHLAHYSSDLVQPLHTTIHYDGRVVNGRSPRTGIHAKVDDLLFRFKPDEIKINADNVRSFDKLFESVVRQIEKTHLLVDRVYKLEPKLPGVKEKVELNAEVKAFALERAAAGVELTASLLLTAWVHLEKVVIPPYMDRTEQDR